MTELITAMREWIDECEWADLNPGEILDPEVFSDSDVLRGVECWAGDEEGHGGVKAFCLDNGFECPEEWKNEE
jgi:hypothetical protein